MISQSFLAQQSTLMSERLRLEPLGPQHFAGTWAYLQDQESMRLTGTHQTFTEEQIHKWLAGLSDHHDRTDWAITRREDGVYVGEIVLNDLDEDNESMGFRIALGAEQLFGRGYGTEATKTVINHAFDDIGLHRVSLEVFSFNTRAQRVYEKCGFVIEGRQRDALRWDGEWFDTIQMGLLATDPRL
ncbi:GNAT family N-acetyltransferase [Arthrobacter pigmenti]